MWRLLFITFVVVFGQYHSGHCQLVEPRLDQGGVERDSLSNIVMSADTVFHTGLDSVSLDTLINNVVLSQDSIVMYCRWAIVKDEMDARAYEDVVIIHHDTIQIFADSMHYYGTTKIARLFGEVILQDGGSRLYTTELTYNVDEKTAHYQAGGTLINEVDTIVSREGYYFQKEKKVRLKGNVAFRDTSKHLYTDSILYLYDIDQLNIIAPTQIIQDSIDIYCEGGIYRLKADRGVLTDNVQVRSDSQYITSGILDIKGAEDTYTFLIEPKMRDIDRYAEGDTIIYNNSLGVIELRSKALYRSPEETLKAPLIIYDSKADAYRTKGRAKVSTGDNDIEANDIVGDDQDTTYLSGRVVIIDNKNDIKIESEEAIKKDETTKLYSPGSQPLLTYQLSSDKLFLLGDTLISTKEDLSIKPAEIVVDTVQRDSVVLYSMTTGTDITMDSIPLINTVDTTVQEAELKQLFYAINKVRFKNGSTFGVSEHFLFFQQDSMIVLTNNPILWSDSIQLTGDTIKIYLKNNDVHKISLIKNALIVSPDSSGMYNQIKGTLIDNYVVDKSLSTAHVQGNAELFYMIKEEDSYRGINLTKSDEMTFIFADDEISKIEMDGQPESNMYEYEEGMDVRPYYLEGFKWRIDERPTDDIFVYRSSINK